MIIPFVYNLMKKHPTLMPLIHRLPEVDAELDPFLENEKDPAATRALDSSLWELASQRQHYHPTVATMSLIFEDKFTKPQYALEDFLDQTYSTVCVDLFRTKYFC
jgi:U3 small nucleolar RNA-associated protein 19